MAVQSQALAAEKATTQDLLDIYILGRQIEWRYKLDAYDVAVLKTMQATIKKASREVASKFERQLLRTDLSSKQAEQIVHMLDDLSQGVRQSISDQIGDAATHAGVHSLAEHADILSVSGLATVGINTVSVAPEQLRQMFVETPLGGKHLVEWVDSAFDSTVKAGIKEELNAGILQGEGYPKLVARVRQGFDQLSQQEAVTLTRTYVQSANVAAMEATYKANADVVKRVMWRATLEPGYKKTGHGTCLRCSALDGQTWALSDDSRPDCPLHPNCRCILVPLTPTWRDLGIDAPELEAAARPYTMREDKAIGAGGTREIMEYGVHQGNYSDWFEKQSDLFKLNVVGPGRMDLLRSGAVSFGDLVDGSGELRTLKELEGLKK